MNFRLLYMGFLLFTAMKSTIHASFINKLGRISSQARRSSIVRKIVAATPVVSLVSQADGQKQEPVNKSIHSPKMGLPSPLSICKALEAAVNFLKVSPDEVVPANKEQKDFLEGDYKIYGQHKTDGLFKKDELKAYVDYNIQRLNKILRDNGFSIQLDEPTDENAFKFQKPVGVVAIQNILVKWRDKALPRPIHVNERDYSGFFLGEDVSIFVDNNDNPTVIIAEIATQSNDKVYCAVRVRASNKGIELLPFFDGQSKAGDYDVMHAINSLKEQYKDSSISSYNGVALPMVNYREQPSIKWMEGLKLSPEAIVTQALQEVIFKMNEDGAQSKAACAIGMSVMMAPPSAPQEPLVVNQPFLLWVERRGMPLPIFAAYLQEKYWENPGALEGHSK